MVESFAVWCPTCTTQQNIIKDLHNEVGNSIVSISINTDSNEDSGVIISHTQTHGFKWRYSVSPIELTRSLIDEFGVSIVNAPSVSMILICPNGDYYKLKNGIKQKDEILSEIETKCNA